MENTSLPEAGLIPPAMPTNPEIPLPNETAGPFNFDIDMMEFEDLLDVLPIEMGVDNNAFYDSMLSAANGSYNVGW